MDDPQTADGDRPAERIVLCKSQPRGKKEEAIVSNAERHLFDDLRKPAIFYTRALFLFNKNLDGLSWEYEGALPAELTDK